MESKFLSYSFFLTNVSFFFLQKCLKLVPLQKTFVVVVTNIFTKTLKLAQQMYMPFQHFYSCDCKYNLQSKCSLRSLSIVQSDRSDQSALKWNTRVIRSGSSQNVSAHGSELLSSPTLVG